MKTKSTKVIDFLDKNFPKTNVMDLFLILVYFCLIILACIAIYYEVSISKNTEINTFDYIHLETLEKLHCGEEMKGLFNNAMRDDGMISKKEYVLIDKQCRKVGDEKMKQELLEKYKG